MQLAETFKNAIVRLTDREQKIVKVCVCDLHINPNAPALQLHRITHAKDKKLWSARVNNNLRLILYRSGSTTEVLYVDHHDKAYAWAQRQPARADLGRRFNQGYYAAIGIGLILAGLITFDIVVRRSSTLPEQVRAEGPDPAPRVIDAPLLDQDGDRPEDLALAHRGRVLASEVGAYRTRLNNFIPERFRGTWAATPAFCSRAAGPDVVNLTELEAWQGDLGGAVMAISERADTITVITSVTDRARGQKFAGQLVYQFRMSSGGRRLDQLVDGKMEHSYVRCPVAPR